MLTRADRTVANVYVYDDFGAFRDVTEAISNPYAFTGREYDLAVDLIYYRARWYDPFVGRFLTRDPAGMADGPNVYAYVANNPVSRKDPSGLGCAWWDFWCKFVCGICIFAAWGIRLAILYGFFYLSWGVTPCVAFGAAICSPLWAAGGLGFVICMGLMITLCTALVMVGFLLAAESLCARVGLC